MKEIYESPRIDIIDIDHDIITSSQSQGSTPLNDGDANFSK